MEGRNFRDFGCGETASKSVGFLRLAGQFRAMRFQTLGNGALRLPAERDVPVVVLFFCRCADALKLDDRKLQCP